MVTELKIDSQLITETIDSCPRAYEELYRRYSPMVSSILSNRCAGDRDLAKDLMQETFIKAFVNIRQFDPKYEFGPWLAAIARNAFIDHTRRRRNEPLDSTSDAPSDSPDPEQQVINYQSTHSVENAISRLPDHYRTIFTLRYLEELSYEEIATRLEMPMGTVKTQLHRARERLLLELGVTNFFK